MWIINFIIRKYVFFLFQMYYKLGYSMLVKYWLRVSTDFHYDWKEVVIIDIGDGVMIIQIE